MDRMKIVILDGISVNPGDLSWDSLRELGDLTVYDDSVYEECFERMKGADAVFLSKVKMDRELIESDPKLKFLGLFATGTDNLDIGAARDNGIACTNIPAYSTEAVSQHAVALMLELSNHAGLHSESVRRGEWNNKNGFCYWKQPLTLLAGKTMGIIGYGHIGSRVASICEALGMKIKIYSRDGDEALAADFVSLHIPALPETVGFINKKTISKMKDGAFLINTARGALINEADLAEALKSGKIAGFGADVLLHEPPAADDPLVNLPNCIITPHNAWSPKETRAILCSTCAENLRSWLQGGTLNRVDL